MDPTFHGGAVNVDRLDHRSDTPRGGGCDRLQGRGYRVGGGYAQKETANRYLLRFDNLDIETRGSVVISPSGD